MKTWFDTSIKIWWLLQGIILFVFGLFAWTPLSVTGIIVLISTCLYSNSNLGLASRILLAVYSLAYIIFIVMLIAVGSPQIGFALGLVIVGIANVILSIKLVISSLSGR